MQKPSETPIQVFPIDPYLPAIVDALKNAPFVLLKAEPGAGKTSRVPEVLLEAFPRILVVQPRRLAARLAAEWLAQRSGEALGETIGYQIRLENKTSAATRLTFVTEGVLTRKILQDRRLSAYDVIVLDEFHERHIHTDLALAMLKELAAERPELRVLVMSATIDLVPLQAYLGEVPTFDIPGRTFPVTLHYRPPAGKLALEDQVSAAVSSMLDEPKAQGNILVFLSGLGEIQSCAEKLRARLGSRIDIIPLTAELAANYRQIYDPSERCKVILSTNVAETSVTLPDIRGVIDSGWAKISGFAPWSGLPTLEKQRISQASAIQRAGRAGRVAEGVCYRLYSAVDFQGRAAFTQAEISRIDLAQTLLEVQAIFPERPCAWENLSWFEAPDPEIVSGQKELLTRLGALNDQGFLTPIGRAMAELPLHPRLARLALEGKASGVGEQTLLAAILIHEGMLLRRGELPREHGLCDISHQLQILLSPLAPSVDRPKVQRMRQLYENLRRHLATHVPWNQIKIEEAAIRRAIFMTFADRVAKFRPLAVRGSRQQRHYNFCLGRGGILSDSSVVREAEWFVAVEARETLGDEGGQRSHIEVASAIDPEWLAIDPFALLGEEREVSVDAKTGRARKVLRQVYGKLVVSENWEQAAGAELADVLLSTLKERWAEIDTAALDSYHAKLALLERHGIEHKLPLFEGDYLELLLAHLCEGASSVAEVLKRDLKRAIDEQLDSGDLWHLAQACPDSVKLDNNRRMNVHYVKGCEPWIEARIQEFFGQHDTPRICQGRQLLQCKLLAPNRRPAQMTQDLRGFWLGSYQEVKKELKRRYPKHAWPDDPLQASPPPPRP